MDDTVTIVNLPDEGFLRAWSSIIVPGAVRTRLVAHSLLTFTLRERLPFEVAPIHGLILLEGPPGTGKTTLARGLADQVARAFPGKRVTFVLVDPHRLMSAALGRTQQQVSKLFEQRIPELAADGPCIVLLDEVETMAVDRYKLSLEANPIDVHRATDAVLAGLDHLTQQCRSVLILATTNFAKAVDAAFLSRADLVERLGVPDAEARARIIRDLVEYMGEPWPGLRKLLGGLDRLVEASEGLDGRRLRKAIVLAAAQAKATARDPNLLTVKQAVDYVLTVRSAGEGG